MRIARAALAALLAALPARAEPPAGWEGALTAGHAIAVAADPVAIGPGTQGALALRGAWVLTSPDPDFGGLSGLLVDGDRLIAVSDEGRWFGARLVRSGTALSVDDARIAAMADGDGPLTGKAGGDAEDLALAGGRLAVAFERDHRVMWLRDNGRLSVTTQPRAFEQMASNKGLEGLATLPDGRLIALAEGRDGAGAPVFVLDAAGGMTEGRLPIEGPHAVTGAAMAPDGRLYLVLRDYSVLFGPSIRVMRFRITPEGLPDPASAETLAAWEAASGIDNMEGIALVARPDGALDLWLVSDDNFNPLQRTLLILCEVLQ